MLNNTPTPIHLPNLWTGNLRHLQAGCKDLRRRKCINQANCEWKDGKCSRKALGCRRISNEGKCNANRNCEWRDTKCRRKSIDPDDGSDPDPEEIPDNVADEILERLEDYGSVAPSGSGGSSRLSNICLCKNKHDPLVSATITAISSSYLYGGNYCYKFQLALPMIKNWNHCVCKGLPLFTTFAFPEGGENCECFN